MPRQTNLVKRQGSAAYYARLAIPRDLLGAYPGKRELIKSTRTADVTQARRIAAMILAEWHDEFATKRQRRAVTQDDLNRAAWQRYEQIVGDDDAFRATAPKKRDLDAVWQQLEEEYGTENITSFRVFEEIRDYVSRNKAERAGRLAALKEAATEAEIEPVEAEVQAFIEQHRLDVKPGTREFNQIGIHVLRGEIEGLTRTVERDAGDYTGQPKDSAVKPPSGAAPVIAPKPRTSPLLLDLFDQFRREQGDNATQDTWNMNRAIVVLFDEFLGGNADVSKVTRANVRDWKAKLFEWPIKAADRKVFKGKTFLEIIEANKTHKVRTIEKKTANRYLSALGAFCTWLLAGDYINQDVMAGQYLAVDKSKAKRDPFDLGQLATLFASPLFHTCESDKREHRPGDVKVRDWRFWTPLVALYSGARLGEILQLDVSDVREERDVWIMHINDAGEKRVKTAGSVRVIPIHPELIRIGFLRYHATRTAKGGRLFPEVKADARGFLSGPASKFFGSYFKAIAVKTDKRLTFHSFRHGITDAFRRASYLDNQIAPLLGHTGATTTGRYGKLSELELKQRVEIINSVSYPGLDLSSVIY